MIDKKINNTNEKDNNIDFDKKKYDDLNQDDLDLNLMKKLKKN